MITLLSDFGLDDVYVGAVKGAILSVNPSAILVDLTHTIAPQDIRGGALALASAYPYFPPGTVHLAVVDPGVGTERRALAVAADGQRFVGPDNGLLDLVTRRPGARAVALLDARYHRGPVSATFHGRDIFAPVAGHCSLGVPLERLGPRVRTPVRLAWPEPVVHGRRILGTVIRADRFGNLLTNLPGDLAVATSTIALGNRRFGPVVSTYSDVPTGGIGALVDSSGLIEIFVRNGSARSRLKARPGVRVILSPKGEWTERSAAARTLTSRTEWSLARLLVLSRTRRPSSWTRTGNPSRTSRHLSE